MSTIIRGAAEMAGRHTQAVPLGLIVLLGILIRVPGLGYCLGSDDIMSVESFLRWGPQTFLFGEFFSNNHPFASLCSWAACLVFGDRDWAIKLPAFLFGVGAIPLVYVLGRRLFRDPWCGLAAALLLAAAPAHAGYSTAFRGFSAAMFFAIASALLLHENLRRPSWLASAGLAACTLLMGMSHLFFLLLMGSWGLVLVGYALGCAIIRDYRCRKALIAFASTSLALGMGVLLVAVAYSPALNLIGETWHRLIQGVWSPAMLGWLSGSEGSPNAFPFHMMTEVITGFTGAPFWFASALVTVGCVSALAKGRYGATISLAGLVVPLAIARVAGLNPGPRYLLEVLPFFVLTLGAGVAYVAHAAGALLMWVLPCRAHSVAFCMLMMVVLCGYVPIYSRDFPHGPESVACNPSDYRSAVEFAVAEMAPDDILDCERFHQPLDYYLARATPAGAFTDASPLQEYRVWILVYSFVPDFKGFPLRSEPELFATFPGCTLWVAQPTVGPMREVPLALLAETGQTEEGFRRWRSGTMVGQSQQEAEGGTLMVRASGPTRVSTGLTQDPVPVGERKRVIFRAQVSDGSARRTARLWLRYLDARGVHLREYPRYARIPEARQPESSIQLGVLTPAGTAFVQPEIGVEGMLNPGEEVLFHAVKMWVEGE